MKLGAMIAGLGLATQVAAAQSGPSRARQSRPSGLADDFSMYDGQPLGARGYLQADRLGVAVGPAEVGGDTSAAAPPSRVLFLNNCQSASCSIRPGNFDATRPDDSRTNTSYIVRGASNLALTPYAGSAASWNAIVACVRENYAPFNIQIVTTEPPASTSYYEAFAAGRPGELGFPSNNEGVASLSCVGVIPNAISFSFLNLYPNDVDHACWIISQETAHNFGLHHSMLSTDAMTYQPAPARKRFINQTACIGTASCCQPAAECMCPVANNEQNSYQRLLAIFGVAGALPPAIDVQTPTPGQLVEPGFTVRAIVTDSEGVRRVDLLIDGALSASLAAAPYQFATPATLRPGAHSLTLLATDTTDLTSMARVEVVVSDATTPPLGALGDTCVGDDDCATGLCAEQGGLRLCSQACELGSASCGAGYSCLANPSGGGLCWTGDDGAASCGGCNTDGSSAPLAVGLVLAALAGRPRRRR